MQKYNFDVCGLLKTKLVSSKLQFMHRFRLKRWNLVSNVDAAGTTRVVVLWNPSTVHVDLIDSSPQAIDVSICSLSTHHTFAATFVYDFNTINARRSLWDRLKSWAPSSRLFWMILIPLCHKRTSTMVPLSHLLKSLISEYAVQTWASLI
jgi:hypothetical protein